MNPPLSMRGHCKDWLLLMKSEDSPDLDFSIIRNPSKGKLIQITSQGITKRFPWHEFSEIFYRNRTFPLGGLTLPKVTQYYSPRFQYKDRTFVFLFRSMNPKLISYENELGDDVSGYIPWTHMFTLIDLDYQAITDNVLFFSEEQIKSEFMHDFYIPNVEEEYLIEVPAFKALFDFDKPLFSYKSLYTSGVTYEPASFGNTINSIWKEMTVSYLRNCVWNTPISSDVNILKDKFKLFVNNFDSPISISMFEDFCSENVSTTQSLYEMLLELYTSKQIAPQAEESIKV